MDEGEHIGLTAYGPTGEDLVFPLMDYCLYLSTVEALNKKTVKGETIYVKRFLEFLIAGGIDLCNASDLVLTKFRDAEFKRVMVNANSSGSERAARRTVNAKLRRVYLFLEWFQDVEKAKQFLIGPLGCQVKSILGRNKRPYKTSDQKLRFSSNDKWRYPLLYRQVGSHSKHQTKYISTSKDVEELTAHFLNSYPTVIASRNILILELANRVGLRRSSINSLRADQFSGEQLERSDGDLSVVPDSQKFGYENRYDIPFRLAYRIADYIENVRTPMMRAKGWSEQQAKGRLFFSFKTGKPLTDNSLSQIFGKAHDSLGNHEHGANIHSMRRKFTNDQIENEILVRKEQGLDTSVASIAASVSLALGHRNADSIAPYVSRKQGRFRLNDEMTPKERIAELEMEVQHLKVRLAESKIERTRKLKKTK
ncbi:hypothetical protein ACFQUU_10690 [Herbaspirillum sp. GCM10030257]|uniref:hypothetical protein n=1 Tax=Herbaspirillum sp. GCM10030257 TaxID=3273393 RepID=UPI00361A1966